MNELYVSSIWLYFKTNADNYEDAWKEFETRCEQAGIVIGGGEGGTLRDKYGNDIEEAIW